MKNLKVLITSLSLIFSSTFSFASRDLPPRENAGKIKITSKTPEGERVEITNYTIDSNSGESLIEEISKSASKDIKDSTKVEIFEVVVNDPKIQSKAESLKNKIIKRLKIKSISEYKTVITDAIRNKNKQASELFKMHERISLSIVRTLVNGGTVSAGLIINGGLSPMTGLSIGFLSGSISGFFQYFNATFQTLIDGSPEKNKLTIETKNLARLELSHIK